MTNLRAVRQRPTILIAGGGVAALECLLALRELMGDLVAIELVCPERDFVYRPVSVAEPFNRAAARRFGIGTIAATHHAALREDALASVDAQARVVSLHSGGELRYDALVIATGARVHEAIPGALTFRGPADTASVSQLLAELDAGTVRRVAFALPEDMTWPLPLYELALLTAGHMRDRGVEAELTLVTPESAPLTVFGPPVSRGVRELLDRFGVRFVGGTQPVAAADGQLACDGRPAIAADRVIAVARLDGRPVDGLPQDDRGFIPTGAHGAVDGAPGVYAAGDATTSPIKQGGLAAQQADAVARAIAAQLGRAVTLKPFPPVLRAVLLTPDGARYLRATVTPHGAVDAQIAPYSLWWPPSKIAGRLLAPYLADVPHPGEQSPALHDQRVIPGAPQPSPEQHRDAVETILALADDNAVTGDYGLALSALSAAEALDGTLPAKYTTKRRRWALQRRGQRA